MDRSTRIRTGSLLVLGLFALGGAVLWGMFLSPRSPASPPAPAEAVFGVPDRKLRFVSYNILHNQLGLDAVVAQIKKLEPDFVLLQEVESRDLIDLAQGLG